jgi:hypothetical protein
MMPKERNKKPVRNQSRTVGLQAVEARKVDVIRGVEEVYAGGKIEEVPEDALEDVFLPDYGGSD